MSTYIVIELKARSTQARDRYAAGAPPLLEAFGGQFVARGPWLPAAGDSAFMHGAIVYFPDADTARAFYASPDYQALIEGSEAAIDCEFRVVG
uniref:DUF1330 domain-containing protein n=1 Tax=Caulobacter sp. (strain K31) TaxID=366602 RepID=B0T956_CAUSK